jgi:NADH-quinone oxidoreductase subunit L
VLVDTITLLASALASGAGFCLAYWLYIRHWGLAERWTASARGIYNLLFKGFGVDEAYSLAVAKPMRRVGEILSDMIEPRGIDAAVNGIGRLTLLAGDVLRRLQTGLLRNYALGILLGAVITVAYFVLRGVLGSR